MFTVGTDWRSTYIHKSHYKENRYERHIYMYTNDLFIAYAKIFYVIISCCILIAVLCVYALDNSEEGDENECTLILMNISV